MNDISVDFRIIEELCRVIAERREKMPAGSYTTYLFEQGEDKILKKVGEEAAEVIIAAKNDSTKELAGEAADLLYHLLVLLCAKGLSLHEVLDELRVRREKSLFAAKCGMSKSR